MQAGPIRMSNLPNYPGVAWITKPVLPVRHARKGALLNNREAGLLGGRHFREHLPQNAMVTASLAE